MIALLKEDYLEVPLREFYSWHINGPQTEECAIALGYTVSYGHLTVIFTKNKA